MKAIVFGATGLVGKKLTNHLLENPLIDDVVIFVRKKTGLRDVKLHEHIVDFENLDEWKNQIQGDIVFSALGTTIKTAGSKVGQYKVDYELQLELAKTALENSVKNYVLISTVNANGKSLFFYLKIKGQLEDKINQMSFESISILRPGPLKGDRDVPRLGEILSGKLIEALPKFLVPPSIRPVEADKVAKVAIKAGLSREKGIQLIGPEVILKG